MLEEKLENVITTGNIKYKAFDKLCKLQKLIQKESALKKLCK